MNTSILVSRPPEKRKVAGSIPALATAFYFHRHGSMHLVVGLICLVLGVLRPGPAGWCGVAQGFLPVAKAGAGFAGQAGVDVAQIVNSQWGQVGFRQGFVSVRVPAPVVGTQHCCWPDPDWVIRVISSRGPAILGHRQNGEIEMGEQEALERLVALGLLTRLIDDADIETAGS